MKGAHILDPTLGEENLLLGLIEYGLDAGYTVEELPVENLYGIELNKEIFSIAYKKLKSITGNAFRKQNFVCADVLMFSFKRKFDVIFGNPLWVNYSNLPDEYR